MTLDTIVSIPDLFQARRVLCIQPHYDDNDIAAAGTLTLLRQAGAALFYLTVTDDLMGVVDTGLAPAAAAALLQRDQAAAGAILGVNEQIWLGYPDAGDYDYFALRRDLLAHLRRLQPDFIFAPDPWLTYEAHRDHIQTGLAAAEAAIFAGLTRIASSDPAVDAAYAGHALEGVAFYYTRKPNVTVDVAATWQTKIDAVQCYAAQFTPAEMEQLVVALEMKARQAAAAYGFARGEPLKVLPTSALHCGF